MRDDLLCEVKGRVIDKTGEPLVGRAIEFLPNRPYFILAGTPYCPIGARTVTDARGSFRVLLTRSDLTGVHYLTRGALGNYRVVLNGPGPHAISGLLKAGQKLAPLSHDS